MRTPFATVFMRRLVACRIQINVLFKKHIGPKTSLYIYALSNRLIWLGPSALIIQVLPGFD